MELLLWPDGNSIHVICFVHLHALFSFQCVRGEVLGKLNVWGFGHPIYGRFWDEILHNAMVVASIIRNKGVEIKPRGMLWGVGTGYTH